MAIKTYNNRVFYALCVVDFLLRIEWGISTGMLPLYVHELGGSPVEVGLIFTVFAGISMGCYPLWGALSDYLGRRKLLIVLGMAALAPIFLLISLQTQVLLLILLRGSTAIFKAAVVPTLMALVTDLSPPEIVGRNLGILGSIEMAGWALGPIIGGLLSDVFGFPVLWVFVAAECFIGAVIFLIFGADPPRIHRSQRAFFAAFRKPRLLSRLSMISLTFTIFLFGFSLLSPSLNIYLYDTLGFSRTLVGTLTFLGSGVTMLLQPLAGTYSDKYGRRPFLIIAALNLAFGNLVLYLAHSVPVALLAQVLIRNYDIFQIIGSAYVADVVPSSDKSAALGLLNSVGSLARSVGALLGGYIITLTSIEFLILISAVFPVISIVLILFFVQESKGEV